MWTNDGPVKWRIYVRNRKHQQALSRLRVSSHNLLKEQGRHSRPVVPRNERLCKFCPLNEIDDEIHSLMTCTFHSDKRNALFKITYPLLGVKDYSEKCTNFKIIMSSKEPKVLQSLAKFMYISLKKKREEILWGYPHDYFIAYVKHIGFMIYVGFKILPET